MGVVPAMSAEYSRKDLVIITYVLNMWWLHALQMSMLTHEY